MRALVLTCLLTTALSAPAQTTLYSEGFSGPVGSLPAEWQTRVDNATLTVARNDGLGEHEHRLQGAPSGTLRLLSWLEAPAETDRGAWRDASTEALLRFSGGAGNQNGLIARARNPDVAAGDYYHVRINGTNLQLYRFNAGSATLLLATNALPGFVASSDHLMRFTTQNVRNPGTDHVRLVAQVYNGATEASGLLAEVEFTDTSANAVTRAGGVGMRTFFTSPAGSGSRATFDDFRVHSQHPNLLWYDDYYDNQALRTESFVSGSAVSILNAQRVEMQNLSSGAVGARTLDFDAETARAEWENVVASTTLRLNTNNAGGEMAGGLLVRETGMSSAAGSGDYYHYRVVRDEATGLHRTELVRVNAGVESLLSTSSLSAAEAGESVNLFMRLEAFTTASGVDLRGLLSQNLDFSAPYGQIVFTDLDPGRITGPGAVGVLARGLSGLTSGVMNFDNFTVEVAVPEPSTAALLLLGLAVAWRRRS
jgi:hypothetical protein